MSIVSWDGFLAAAKQRIILQKTASRTSVAAVPFSVFDLAGSPGAGTLAGANTANGVVPTDATAGCAIINAFAGSKGYLTRFEYAAPVPMRITLHDMLFKAGAYAFNANTTLASQPSYSSRVPNGTDYSGTEIWIEAVTAFTGTPSFQINYLDEGGNAGDTGVVSAGAALTVGRMFRMPLAAGDSGVSQITQVRGTVATVGTFNVLVLRPLAAGRVAVANAGDVQGLDRTGMIEVFADSALTLQITADSTATSTSEVLIDIANG